MRYKLLLLFLMLSTITYGQNKQEREFRVKKSDFPVNAFQILDIKLNEVKKLRFYKEIDGNKISYEAKFKKNKLWYSVEFSEAGELEDIEIDVKKIDLPNISLAQIETYLNSNFESFKIKKIQQQYVLGTSVDLTFQNAFQNLLLPSINYELIIDVKKEKKYQEFEMLFNAQGIFIKSRKSIPPNYDHVLY